MGATIAQLDTIGWNPVSPFKWINHKMEAWACTPGTSGIPIIREMTEHLKTLMWKRAADHRNGKGLELGGDLTVAEKHMKYLKNKGENGQKAC